jgi:hypothetical protein
MKAIVETAKEAIKRAIGVSGRAAKLQPKLEQIDAVDARLPEITEERQKLTGAVANAEVVARGQAWFQRTRAAYFSDPGQYDVAAHAHFVREPLSRWDKPEDPHIPPADVWPLLVALLHDQLVAGLPAFVAARPDPGGPPSAERVARVGALDAERARLVAERRQLVTEVNDEPEAERIVTLKHLEETQAEINAEERQKQRDAEQAEHRAQIEKWKQTTGHPLGTHQATMHPDRRG